MQKVCHVTSVHDALDDRIYYKECLSLTEEGYQVFLVALGETFTKDGIQIIGCGEQPRSRVERFSKFCKKVFQKALNIDADVYHFHDPEMLKYAAKLAKMHKVVIFDSHEDVPAQILDKPWIPKRSRQFVSKVYKRLETKYVKELSGVITATEYIENKFKDRAKRTETIKNYPKLDEIIKDETAFAERDKAVCYAGGISHIRGEKIMVSAMEEMEGYSLKLAGNCDDETLKNSKPKNVEYLGVLSREGVNDLYASSRVGICVLLPTANYINSLPIKIFEYMAAGLPIIASDFPIWREIITEANSGVLVNPEDIVAIRDAIKYYIDHPVEAQETGERGYRVATGKYNWRVEGKKLVDFYKKLLA